MSMLTDAEKALVKTTARAIEIAEPGFNTALESAWIMTCKSLLAIIDRFAAQPEQPKAAWVPNNPFTGTCSKCRADGNLKQRYCGNCGRRMTTRKELDDG